MCSVTFVLLFVACCRSVCVSACLVCGKTEDFEEESERRHQTRDNKRVSGCKEHHASLPKEKVGGLETACLGV